MVWIRAEGPVIINLMSRGATMKIGVLSAVILLVLVALAMLPAVRTVSLSSKPLIGAHEPARR